MRQFDTLGFTAGMMANILCRFNLRNYYNQNRDSNTCPQ